MKRLFRKIWCWAVGHIALGREIPGGVALDDPRCQRCGLDIDDFPEKRGRIGKVI